jgi:hypothetical protein
MNVNEHESEPKMMDLVFGEADDFEFLFLLEIEEPEENVLSLTVREAAALGEAVPVHVAGVDLGPARRIGATKESPSFTVVWSRYVAYSVRNESYATTDESEACAGKHFRLYTKSNFLDYVARATFACDECPGPLRHWCVGTESHIIDVVSATDPEIKHVAGSPQPSHVH